MSDQSVFVSEDGTYGHFTITRKEFHQLTYFNINPANFAVELLKDQVEKFGAKLVVQTERDIASGDFTVNWWGSCPYCAGHLDRDGVVREVCQLCEDKLPDCSGYFKKVATLSDDGVEIEIEKTKED